MSDKAKRHHQNKENAISATKHFSIETYRRRGGKDPRFLNHGSRWGKLLTF